MHLRARARSIWWASRRRRGCDHGYSTLSVSRLRLSPVHDLALAPALSLSATRARAFVRRLHARHALGTATTLSPAHLRLSPVHGLALLGTPALGLLHASDGPAAELARALFHRNAGQTDGAPAAPLLPTHNRSLPAAHLTPALQGTCLGLALRRPPQLRSC